MSRDSKKRRVRDPDNAQLDTATLARLRPARMVVPQVVAAAKRRGRPPLERPKEAIKLRIDADVLDTFRKTGAGWQTRINETLRKAAGRIRG